MMKVSGIILKTMAYKERDLIVQVLLEDGHIVSFYAFGGRGGGKKIKPTILELGNAINFEIENNLNGKNTDISMAREWSLRWSSKEIKKNFLAFSLMCLCFEIMLKIIPHSKINDEIYNENNTLFNVISNFLFQLDQAVLMKKNLIGLFAFTTGKLISHLGLKPDLYNCIICGQDLEASKQLMFSGQNGGFICHHCFTGNENLHEVHQSIEIYKTFSVSFETKFQEWEQLPSIEKSSLRKMILYLAENFQFDVKDLNSFTLIF